MLRETWKIADASVILPVFSQYARTFLRKSNEYAINTLYHKCTVFVSFNYIAGLLLGKSFLLLIALYIAAAYFLPYKEDRDAERYGTGPRKIKEAEKINKSWFE
ncbi:alcohol dehydrogenase [Streptococcus suis]|uniref:Iron-containing alcohol dehydrogenase n=1 Tax=Streptococcus suis (strain GZ1) TaxID=423211 RepID=D5AJ80_STRGZ|nr:Iron-containing alcohol dehydrogenase [Streptococcus suis GZ1]AER15733.1 Iron-containing alcohol dehydrogenase [Streptococcus suis SS12]AER21839.1 Iron-containing alcohol dehydrogenase [Streptococcus suis ST1]AGG64946.1 hypothetical protein NJAUSS_1485 [Streptococcus suis SC070731]ARL70415.1 alcohol dehydrogenase [Streptococcus suis]